MTQLSLFDAFTTSNSSATVVMAPETAPSPQYRPGINELPAEPTEADALQPQRDEDGVYRMGDLARLVILRYQVAAKRREEQAARKAIAAAERAAALAEGVFTKERQRRAAERDAAQSSAQLASSC